MCLGVLLLRQRRLLLQGAVAGHLYNQPVWLCCCCRCVCRVAVLDSHDSAVVYEEQLAQSSKPCALEATQSADCNIISNSPSSISLTKTDAGLPKCVPTASTFDYMDRAWYKIVCIRHSAGLCSICMPGLFYK